MFVIQATAKLGTLLAAMEFVPNRSVVCFLCTRQFTAHVDHGASLTRAVVCLVDRRRSHSA